MGLGDQLIATGLARGAAARGRRMAFGDGRRIAWDHNSEIVFRHNPHIAPPGSEGSPDLEWHPFRKGCRLYNWHDQVNNRWVWTDGFRCIEGEVFLSVDERRWAEGIGRDFVIIEPTIERWKPIWPNKQWPEDRYDAVAAALIRDGRDVVQFRYVKGGRILPGVRQVNTPTFRHAAAAMERASMYVGPEGGLHHLAAAFRKPAVVIFGAWIPAHVTGYRGHINLASSGEACGSLSPCRHCMDALAAITVDDVLAATVGAPHRARFAWAAEMETTANG